MKSIDKTRDSLPKLQKRRNAILKQLKTFEGRQMVDLSDIEIERKFLLQDSLKEYNNKIETIEKNMDENDYFLQNGHILFEYYDRKNKNTVNKKSISKIKKNNNTVLSFFSNGEKNVADNQQQQNEKKQDGLSKRDIVNQYLSYVDPNYIKKTDEVEVNDERVNICTSCNVELYIYKTDGISICPKCSRQERIIIESDKPSYKDPPKEIAYFSYKRINHFNECLAQFQAKESTDIPGEVFDKILLEIDKERIVNMADLTTEKLREILKKLKLNKYYEHIPHIINRLNGIQAPTLTREIEEKLRSMFKEVQAPFMKYCPKDRVNFLSYSYVLYKFVELLELDEFLSSFPLLKSREKLHQQDQIWKCVCEDLGWEFIKSL
jgi:predicted RNA-binding Zn-ribbon protein involved in translation (DUF1610 family)